MDRVTLYLGDCLDVMRELPDASVDAVVTDPPYGLEFMGKEWDRLADVQRSLRGKTSGLPTGPGSGRGTSPTAGRPGFDLSHTSQRAMQAWHEQWATEAFRLLKPGGYLLAFGGTRTYHRLASAIEDAGFEIRDTLMWIYASGFPKSLDVSKALDKVAGAEREVTGIRPDAAKLNKPGNSQYHEGWQRPWKDDPEAWERKAQVTAPATDLARKWEGWGTALKPAHEPIVMARKPLIGTVAANVTRYGTGALNIDGTRIPGEPWQAHDASGLASVKFFTDGEAPVIHKEPHNGGRWPSNVLLSSPELFDEPNPGVVGSGQVVSSHDTTGIWSARAGREGATTDGWGMKARGAEDRQPGRADSGGYSRFFAIPRRTDASQSEVRDLPDADGGAGPGVGEAEVSDALREPYPRALIIPKADRAERERGLAGAPKAIGKIGNHGNLSAGDDLSIKLGSNQPRANVHPTVKPIDLMRHLVRLVTPPGGVVLDPFLGSGTTALAASEEGFRCIGIEREAEYLEIAKGRLMATPMGLGL